MESDSLRSLRGTGDKIAGGTRGAHSEAVTELAAEPRRGDVEHLRGGLA